MAYTLNGTTNRYYFQRNLLGDVVGIFDTSGGLVVRYLYDAWGNCTISSDTANDALAHANPIRYRGYCYDDDTGLYYCNARYYSPKWRRFISPDDTAYLNPESVNGLNLYCYCNNDPVNKCDPTGHKWYKTAWEWLVNAVDTVAGFCSDLFGFGTVLANRYDMFKLQTIFGHVETGFCTSKTIDGDVSKPISIFWQKASRWYAFTEYKLGLQFNIGDGGFAIALGLGEIEGSFSFGTGWTLELFAGIDKIGYTLTKNADFGTHEGGSYVHGYIRTIPVVMVLLLAVFGAYALCGLAPIFA